MKRGQWKKFLIFVILIAAILHCAVYVLKYEQPQDVTEIDELEVKILELKERLHYAEQLHRERRRDLMLLRSYLRSANISDAASSNRKSINNNNKVMSGPNDDDDDLAVPSILDHLPHLVGGDVVESLRPAYKLTQGRTTVSLVMGIPTIYRDKKTYLYETLASLIDNISIDEADDVVIIVMIAEVNETYVQQEINEIKNRFSDQLSSGILEVISPPASYYPNFTSIKPTLGDTPERARWRTKQNLDFAFLMMYAERKGAYYLQLEDDIMTKPGYITTIRRFILHQKTNDWIALEFSALGFIGKLFRTTDLPIFIQTFLAFHSEKPVDWLLDDIFFIKACNPDIDFKKCQKSKSSYRKRFKPSLFQHMGLHSSLRGKDQKLTDRDFGKGAPLHRPHINPPAEVSTSLKVYQDHTLEKCYLGETFFWGLLPQAGDYVLIGFNPPVLLDRYYIRTGNSRHPHDKFVNTTVELTLVGDVEASTLKHLNFTQIYTSTFLVNSFNDLNGGVVHGNLSELPLPVSHVRFRVLTESDNWIIISEIHFQSRPVDPSHPQSNPSSHPPNP